MGWGPIGDFFEGFNDIDWGNVATGFAVGGPMGALAGTGLFGHTAEDFVTMGKSAQKRAEDRALVAAQKAREEQAALAREQNRKQYIQQIRAARIQRARQANLATTEAGISSGSQGAIASIGSQLSSNINYMQFQTDTLNRIQQYQNLYNKQMAKAEKYNSYYQQGMGLIKLGAQVAGTFAGGPVGGSVAGETVDIMGNIG